MKNIIRYVQESYEEFKKVSWPSKNQSVRLTAYVIGVSVIVGIYASGLDFLFKEALKLILSR